MKKQFILLYSMLALPSSVTMNAAQRPHATISTCMQCIRHDHILAGRLQQKTCSEELENNELKQNESAQQSHENQVYVPTQEDIIFSNIADIINNFIHILQDPSNEHNVALNINAMLQDLGTIIVEAMKKSLIENGIPQNMHKTILSQCNKHINKEIQKRLLARL